MHSMAMLCMPCACVITMERCMISKHLKAGMASCACEIVPKRLQEVSTFDTSTIILGMRR